VLLYDYTVFFGVLRDKSLNENGIQVMILQDD